VEIKVVSFLPQKHPDIKYFVMFSGTHKKISKMMNECCLSGSATVTAVQAPRGIEIGFKLLN